MRKNSYIAVMLIAVILVFSFTPKAFAAKSESLQDNLFGDTQPKLEDGSKAHFQLDVTTVPEKDEDQNAAEEALENAKDFLTGKKISDGVLETVYEVVNFMVNLSFQANVFITTCLIKALDVAFNYSVLNKIIDKMASVMTAFTGINSGGFTKNGLLGSVAPLATALTALVAVYLMLVKRSILAGLKTLGSTLLVMACCLAFFTQYAIFLKGMNQMSTEVSQMVLTSPAKLATGSKDSNQIKQDMYKAVQDQFIMRPYLYMQYGTDDKKKIGQKRIDTLLKMAPGEKRNKYVEDTEVKEKNNLNMTYANVGTRVIFTLYYNFLNVLNGLVLAILAIVLLAIQFWYIAIAAVAGFVFLWAIFPQQIGVLKNYCFYLFEPLMWKVLLSFMTFIFFTISTLTYVLNDSVGGYFETSLAQLAIYTLVFLFRKKIKKIFRNNKQFRYIMTELKTFRKTATQGMETVAQVTATAVGAAVGGVQGAAAGYQAVEAVKERSSSDENEESTTYDPEKQAPSGELKDDKGQWTPPPIMDWRDKQTPKDPEPSDDNQVKRMDLVDLPPLEEKKEDNQAAKKGANE